MMKKILTILLLLPLLGVAQAHLGINEYEIKIQHTDVAFKSGTTEKGTRFISGDMQLGTFYYYFNSSGVSYTNIQIPYTMVNVNAQAEIYNKKYVIVTDHSWKAYVENGGVIYINLDYYEEQKLWMFSYTD